MRPLHGFLVVLLWFPCTVNAQTKRAEGIAALLRGDYTSAVRILQPLAERASPDPLAAFVMASIYHSGIGGPPNLVRACGMYLRAATPRSPLLSQSLALAETIHVNFRPLREECVAASRGPWTYPPPALFTLEKDHWVRIDKERFVVGYKGIEKTASISLGGAGWKYLALRHTSLEVSRPVVARRHFVEFFTWMPSRVDDGVRWFLAWAVYEIVGAEARFVPTAGPIAKTTDDTPPRLAVDEIARLRVNAEGEAEFEVQGPTPRGGVVPFPEAVAAANSPSMIGPRPYAWSATAAKAATAGIEAYARGDFQRAVEVLKPIAEAWPSRDHTIEFLMATLYESGRGIATDAIRACGLYLRSTLSPRGPLSRAGEEWWRARQGSLSRADFHSCTQLTNIGFNHKFEPVTFTLDPGHWVSLDLDGATIEHGGKETRIERGFGLNGGVFLPIQHTELRFGPSQETRRHFVELFTWVPRAPAQTWALLWQVFEVVRNDLVRVANSELTTVAGETPPDEFDPRPLAQLRVNENGYAEWAVLSGPNQRSALIATHKERQEIQEQQRARQAAEARVNWKRVTDSHRPPALAYSDADGCGYALVYGWSDDRTEAITIRADKDLLSLSAAPKTFDLTSPPSGLEVTVHVFEKPIRSWPFCSDFNVEIGSETTWRAVRGIVTIELTPPVVRADKPHASRATIKISSLEVINAEGARARQSQPITLTAIVGHMWGN